MELLDHATMNEAQISRPNLILKQFLLENEPIFVQLTELKAKVGSQSYSVSTYYSRLEGVGKSRSYRTLPEKATASRQCGS